MASISLVFLSILPLALVVCVAVWAVLTLVRSLSVPAGLRDGGACAVCEYPVASLDTVRCPECGTPYATGGVRTAYSVVRDRGSTPGVVLAWTVLCIGLVTIVSIVLSVVSPSRMSGSTITVYQSNAVFRSQGSADTAYELAVDTDLTYNQDSLATTPSGTMTDLASGTISLALVADPSGPAPVVAEQEIEMSASTEFTEAESIAFFEQVGLDGSDPAVIAEARELGALIAVWRDDPQAASAIQTLVPEGGIAAAGGGVVQGPGLTRLSSGVSTSVQNGSSLGRPIWFIVGALAAYIFCILAWVVGLVVCIRRRLSVLRLRPSQPPSPAVDG